MKIKKLMYFSQTQTFKTMISTFRYFRVVNQKIEVVFEKKKKIFCNTVIYKIQPGSITRTMQILNHVKRSAASIRSSVRVQSATVEKGEGRC